MRHTSATAASARAGRIAATAGDNSVPHSVLAGCTPSSTTSGVRLARTRSATSRSATPSWCTLPFARQGLQFLAEHPNQRPGRLPDIHRVQHQQVGTVPNVGKQFQAQRTALNQGDVLRHARIVPQSSRRPAGRYRRHRVQGVAQAEHNVGRWRRHFSPPYSILDLLLPVRPLERTCSR